MNIKEKFKNKSRESCTVHTISICHATIISLHPNPLLNLMLQKEEEEGSHQSVN